MTIQIEDEEQPQARREERRQGGSQSETGDPLTRRMLGRLQPIQRPSQRILRGGAGR